MAPPAAAPAGSGASLRQKLKQKLLKPKYASLKDEEEAARLCAAPHPARDQQLHSEEDDAGAVHDITAALLGDDAAGSPAARSDQGSVSKVRRAGSLAGPRQPAGGGAHVKEVLMKGCFPFANAARQLGAPSSRRASAPPAPSSSPGPSAPKADRVSILSRLGRAAKKAPAAVDAFSSPLRAAAPKAPAVKKNPHALHTAAWRTQAPELAERLGKPGVDVNKRDRVRMLCGTRRQ